MSLIEWNPFREMDNLTREMGSFWDRFPFRYLGPWNSPRVDVYQTDREVVLKAEIPGASKEDFNVYVDNDHIRISGQMRKDSEFKDENVYRSERYYGSFSRTIPLPVEVKPDKAKAEYKDGILTVTAPKASPGKEKGFRVEVQ